MTARQHSARIRAAAALPVLLLAATSLAACGGGSDAKGSAGGASSASADNGAAALGPENKATGTPVKIGFAYEGVTAAIDTSEQAIAAKAVVAYANAHLGGLGGHPIELVTCETKNTPSTAADCGNQFVSAGVLAVTSGSLGQTDPVVKAINAAGISLVDTANTSPSVISSTNNFSITNPLNPFGGPAVIAKKSGVTRVALIVTDVPAAIQPAKQLSPLLFGNVGVQVDVVGIPPGTADLTPQIQAEEAKKPGMYHMIGDPTLCSSALKAIKTLGITTPVTGIDRCLSKQSAASIPGGYAGLKAFTTANLDPAADETKLYQAILKQYANGATSTAGIVAGYQGILAMIRAANAAHISDLTPAGLAAALHSAPATPVPLGGGNTFTCDGKQVAIAPAVCSAGGVIATSDKDGNLSDFQKVDATGIYDVPKH